MSQKNTPVAVNDTLMPIFEFNFTASDTTLYINVLENDFDPDGDPIKIFEVKNRTGQSSVEINFTDSTIILTMSQFNLFENVFDYRICKVDDTNSISNWAYLNVNAALDEDYPIARNDTVYGLPGHPVFINVLKNDYHPLGDTIIIHNVQTISDSIVVIDVPEYSNESFKTKIYIVSDSTFWVPRFDNGLIYIKILNNEWYDSLDINNINARFNCFGNQFWNFEQAHFKVPNGSEVSSIFSQTLWLGGLDDGGTLHLAAETYRQGGVEYWTGPISDVYDSLYDQRWMHVWKLNRDEIEYHKAHYWESAYEPLADILTWPGNGDISYSWGYETV